MIYGFMFYPPTPTQPKLLFYILCVLLLLLLFTCMLMAWCLCGGALYPPAKTDPLLDEGVGWSLCVVGTPTG
jgi:hypothetical protein